MKRKSTILALVIGLTFISMACSKSAANISEDDKHKLFQAVGRTGDNQLIVEVAQKLGLVDTSGQPTAAFQQFTKDHIDWAMKNTDFIKETMDSEKAKAYVKSHMP
jgi:ABC-type oligopeptide transport system substrate-binding subunit